MQAVSWAVHFEPADGGITGKTGHLGTPHWLGASPQPTARSAPQCPPSQHLCPLPICTISPRLPPQRPAQCLGATVFRQCPPGSGQLGGAGGTPPATATGSPGRGEKPAVLRRAICRETWIRVSVRQERSIRLRQRFWRTPPFKRWLLEGSPPRETEARAVREEAAARREGRVRS